MTTILGGLIKKPAHRAGFLISIETGRLLDPVNGVQRGSLARPFDGYGRGPIVEADGRHAPSS